MVVIFEVFKGFNGVKKKKVELPVCSEFPILQPSVNHALHNNEMMKCRILWYLKRKLYKINQPETNCVAMWGRGRGGGVVEGKVLEMLYMRNCHFSSTIQYPTHPTPPLQKKKTFDNLECAHLKHFTSFPTTNNSKLSNIDIQKLWKWLGKKRK